MSDDPRLTVQQLIGRPDDAAPEPARQEAAGVQVSRSHDRLWLVLAAHLRGLLQAGVLDDRSAIAAASALERVAAPITSDDRGTLRQQARSIEERVDAGLPAELVGAVTLGIAAEDWTATAVRMGLRTACVGAGLAASRALGVLVAMADLHSVSLMQGFHTGRPAQPVTFGHLLGGAIAPVARGLDGLILAVDRVNRSPLGAGTMSGEVVGAERAESARWLGFAGPLPNTFDAVANVEDFVAMLDRLAAISAPIARLLDEMATLVRTDPSSFVFADDWMREDAHLPGFSAAEGLVSLASTLRGVVANSAALTSRIRGLPYGPLGAALEWIERDVTGVVERTTRALDDVDRLFRSELTVNRAYLANRAGRNYTTSNDLSAFLMTEEQLPPSIARNIASLTLRRMREEHVEMSAITPEMVDTAAMLVIGRELKVEMETLGRWFAPRRFLERRLVEGSPAPAKTREWLETEAATQRRLADAFAERQRGIDAAEASVRRWIEETAAEPDD